MAAGFSRKELSVLQLRRHILSQKKKRKFLSVYQRTTLFTEEIHWEESIWQWKFLHRLRKFCGCRRSIIWECRKRHRSLNWIWNLRLCGQKRMKGRSVFSAEILAWKSQKIHGLWPFCEMERRWQRVPEEIRLTCAKTGQVWPMRKIRKERPICASSWGFRWENRFMVLESVFLLLQRTGSRWISGMKTGVPVQSSLIRTSRFTWQTKDTASLSTIQEKCPLR